MLPTREHARLTEVGDGHLERDGVYQNAGGLHVAVHQIAAVQVAHRPHQLLHDCAYGGSAHVWRRLLIQPKVECHACVLKYDVNNVALRLENVDYLYDVGVIKPPQDGDFAKDTHGIPSVPSSPQDDNGRVGVVAVEASAPIMLLAVVTASFQKLCETEPVRDIPLKATHAIQPAGLVYWLNALRHFLMAKRKKQLSYQGAQTSSSLQTGS
jgi:hypothetical protein